MNKFSRDLFSTLVHAQRTHTTPPLPIHPRCYSKRWFVIVHLSTLCFYVWKHMLFRDCQTQMQKTTTLLYIFSIFLFQRWSQIIQLHLVNYLILSWPSDCAKQQPFFASNNILSRTMLSLARDKSGVAARLPARHTWLPLLSLLPGEWYLCFLRPSNGSVKELFCFTACDDHN
jgi:hypothetical protein